MEVLNLLSCPSCHTEMSSPIAMCMNGHSLCMGCRERRIFCPVCQAPFAANNLMFEATVHKIKEMRNSLPTGVTKFQPKDLLKDVYRARNTFALDIVDILMIELKCKTCSRSIGIPVNFCFLGHVTCPMHETCPSCIYPRTEGKYIAVETLIRNLLYVCPFQQNGCDKILTMKDDAHREICVFKPVPCPLSTFNDRHCTWMNSTKYLRDHLVEFHVGQYIVVNEPHITVDVHYYMDQYRHHIIYAFNRVFILSLMVKNNCVHCRLELLGPMIEALKYNCTIQFVLNEHSVTNCAFPPSPFWRMFAGGPFMGGHGPSFRVRVAIQNQLENGLAGIDHQLPELNPNFIVLD